MIDMNDVNASQRVAHRCELAHHGENECASAICQQSELRRCWQSWLADLVHAHLLQASSTQSLSQGSVKSCLGGALCWPRILHDVMN